MLPLSSKVLWMLCVACMMTLTGITESQAAPQRRDRTTRRALKADHRLTERHTAAADTVTPSPGMLALSGFAKPLRSTRETLFLTNRSMRRLTHVTLLLVYTDSQGRQLHKRQVAMACDVPPGETRQLTFASFDRQHTFYYHLNGKPRTADGTPFHVTATAERAVFTP